MTPNDTPRPFACNRCGMPSSYGDSIGWWCTDHWVAKARPPMITITWRPAAQPLDGVEVLTLGQGERAPEVAA